MKPGENATTHRDLLRDAFFLATFGQHLGPTILARRPDNTDEAWNLNGRLAGWKFCYDHVYPREPNDLLLIPGGVPSSPLHLDGRERRIPPEVTAENYFHDLRDASLYGSGPTLEKRGIPTQPKLYLANRHHYDTGLLNIPYLLEVRPVICNWRSVMEEQHFGYGSD